MIEQIYKHYKGGHYILINIGEHTETGERFVIYTGLYESSGKVWIRPEDMFFGQVEIDGITVPRFERTQL